jgi:uncharacterized protein YbjT (DUF2867 family)
MRAGALFCAATLLFLAARDLFDADARGVEVWLGFEVHGRAALWSAPLHWAIFAAGAWAFWTGRPWVLPAAAGYAFLVAASHLVWSVASPRGRGLAAGVALAAALSVPGLLLLLAWRRERRRDPEG